MTASAAALLLLVLLLVAVFVSAGVLTYLARQQRDIFVPLPPDEALELAESLFPRLTWAREGGPGTLNVRRRTLAPAVYTLSLDATAARSGSVVSLWLSAANGALGGLVMNNAPSAWLQVARVQRRLEGYAQARGFALDGTPAAADGLDHG